MTSVPNITLKDTRAEARHKGHERTRAQAHQTLHEGKSPLFSEAHGLDWRAAQQDCEVDVLCHSPGYQLGNVERQDEARTNARGHLFTGEGEHGDRGPEGIGSRAVRIVDWSVEKEPSARLGKDTT
jgi:hypothetical protein